MPHEFEPRMRQQVLDVLLAAGEEVVDANHIVPVLDETIAKVGAEKPGAAGDKDAHEPRILNFPFWVTQARKGRPPAPGHIQDRTIDLRNKLGLRR